MNASDDSKKSSRPSAGNSSSMSSNWRFDVLPLAASSVSVRRRAIWLRMSRTRGLVREMSEGGTTK
jgi:hypothetical protein